jgi:hypothetical protein
MFFANDRHTATSKHNSLTKNRIGNASLSKSPELNPKYAESNKGNKFWSFIIALISFHCSGLGSSPVGLCALICRMTIEPGSAAWSVDRYESISRHLFA